MTRPCTDQVLIDRTVLRDLVSIARHSTDLDDDDRDAIRQAREALRAQPRGERQ